MDIYIVKENETIEDIAKKFNLKITDIQSVNDFNLYDLKPGYRLRIPFVLSNDFYYYEIKEGDNLKNIADSNGIDLYTLALINNIDINSYIYPKQLLLLPKENVKVYITESGDTFRDLVYNLDSDINTIIENNPDIYLLANQLLILR